MSTKALGGASLAIIALMLTACGDGGGVNSTPTPPPAPAPSPTPSPTPAPTPTPSPTPPPTPTPPPPPPAGDATSPAAALGVTSDTTFDSATSSFAVRPPNTIYGEQAAEPFGEGTDIAFDASEDSYTLTRSDGLSVTITPADIDADGELQGEGGLFGSSQGTVYVVDEGNITHTVVMVPPGDHGDVSLSYMAISLWNVQDQSGLVPANELQWQIWGLQTQNMPTTGTASYTLDGGIGANGFDPKADSIPAIPGNEGAAYDFLNGQSTGKLTVDFASGDIGVLLHLIGYDYVAAASKDFGDFTGSGAITSGATYSGDFDKGGEFHGAFFGPNAEETGFTFFIDSDDVLATGVAVGVQD